MAKLTVKSVEAVTPTKDRREIPDGYLRGLYLHRAAQRGQVVGGALPA